MCNHHKMSASLKLYLENFSFLVLENYARGDYIVKLYPLCRIECDWKVTLSLLCQEIAASHV